MPKLPGKFDDLSKTAKSALDDDFQVKDSKLELKSKTNLDGAISTIAVDFAANNPAKVTWKFPKPFGIVGFAIDKFEIDKGGALKLECAMKADMHKVKDLTIDAKTDCKAAAKATVGLSYTGIKDAFVKFETKPLNVADFTLECLYGVGPVVVGANFKGPAPPKVGVNYTSGPFFASFLVKPDFSDLTGHAHYKVNNDLSLAAMYAKSGGKDSWSIGGVGKASGINLKAKFDSNNKVSVGCKKEVVKGLTVTAGGAYDVAKGASTCGIKVNIE